MKETLTVVSEFTPLDLLLWRRYGVEEPGLVERTLAANPGLAEGGVYLPVGAQVVVERESRTNLSPVRVVRLWGKTP